MVVESSFLVSVLCREVLSNPNIFCHSFCVTNFHTSFNDPLPSLLLVGGISGWGGIKMTSASTPSANEPGRSSFKAFSVNA